MQKQTPERIYHWLDSQLSIARHYGGCRFNGVEYVIAYNEEGQPLVRKDLLGVGITRLVGKPDVSNAPIVQMDRTTAF